MSVEMQKLARTSYWVAIFIFSETFAKNERVLKPVWAIKSGKNKFCLKTMLISIDHKF